MEVVVEGSLDDAGHILMPAAIRERLGLSPGMTLVVEEGDGDDLRLTAQSKPPTLADKAGVLVIRAESLSSLDNVTRRIRDQRVLELVQ